MRWESGKGWQEARSGVYCREKGKHIRMVLCWRTEIDDGSGGQGKEGIRYPNGQRVMVCAWHQDIQDSPWKLGKRGNPFFAWLRIDRIPGETRPVGSRGAIAAWTTTVQGRSSFRFVLFLAHV